MLLYCLSSARH